MNYPLPKGPGTRCRGGGTGAALRHRAGWRRRGTPGGASKKETTPGEERGGGPTAPGGGHRGLPRRRPLRGARSRGAAGAAPARIVRGRTAPPRGQLRACRRRRRWDRGSPLRGLGKARGSPPATAEAPGPGSERGLPGRGCWGNLARCRRWVCWGGGGWV